MLLNIDMNHWSSWHPDSWDHCGMPSKDTLIKAGLDLTVSPELEARIKELLASLPPEAFLVD